jgi:hypothetical protein
MITGYDDLGQPPPARFWQRRWYHRVQEVLGTSTVCFTEGPMRKGPNPARDEVIVCHSADNYAIMLKRIFPEGVVTAFHSGHDRLLRNLYRRLQD